MTESALIRQLGEALVHSYDGCEDDEVGLEGLEAMEAYGRWKRRGASPVREDPDRPGGDGRDA